MRIDELVNPQNYDADEYDIKEDLIYFMGNDPDFYRKHYYPSMCKMKLHTDKGNDFDSLKFMPMIKYAFEQYKQKFPVRNLQDSLSKEELSDICSKVYESELENIKQGHYDLK